MILTVVEFLLHLGHGLFRLFNNNINYYSIVQVDFSSLLNVSNNPKKHLKPNTYVNHLDIIPRGRSLNGGGTSQLCLTVYIACVFLQRLRVRAHAPPPPPPPSHCMKMVHLRIIPNHSQSLVVIYWDHTGTTANSRYCFIQAN